MTDGQNRALRQFLKFAAAGLVGLIVDVSTLYAMLTVGAGPYSGRIVSFLVAVWCTWKINRRFAFKASRDISIWTEWWKYLASMTGGGVCNYIVYAIFLHLFKDIPLAPYLSVAVGSIAGMAINFISAKFFVFKV